MRKNTNIHIATAKDIYDYLKQQATNGIAEQSKKDVATHFGYKSSNGDGFLSNFAFLEKNKLIEDVSNNKRSSIWKVNDIPNFVFPKKVESIRKDKELAKQLKKEAKAKNTKAKNATNVQHKEDVLMNAKTKRLLKDVRLEYLKPIISGGRKYIPLINLAQALNMDKHSVYNAGSSANKGVSAYIKFVSMDGTDRNTKKAVEVEGLCYLLKRLEKKKDKNILEAVVEYVESKYVSEAVENISEEQTANAVQFPVGVYESQNEEDTAVDLESSASDDDFEDTTTEEQDMQVSLQLDSTEELVTDGDEVTDVDDIIDESDDSSYEDSVNDTLLILDGITTIIEEHRAMKEMIDSYEQQLSASKNEIQDLKAQLSNSKKANIEFLSKTNAIKSYVMENIKVYKHN